MKYGVAFLPSLRPQRMKMGKKIMEMTIREWVGPRRSRPGINRSMSDMTEAKNRRGTFTSIFRSLDVAFPFMYPRARWPTANVCCPSSCLCVSLHSVSYAGPENN